MKRMILFVAGLSLLASCSKNVESDTPIDASKSKMLMDGSWQLKAYMVNPNIYDSLAVPQDMYTPMEGCVKDNFYIFASTSSLIQYEHFHKCQVSAPDSIVLNYTLTNNEKHIKVWANPEDVDHSIILDGDITYPSIDSFVVDYQVYDSVSEVTSGHTKTYVKMP
jgi:hypothetical protein